MDEVEQSVAEAKVPSGKIRVSVNIPVGRLLLLPIVPCVYRKLKLGRSGGEVRQGWRVI